MTPRAVLVLLAVALAGFGWALPWPEPARAGYVLQWLGFALLCVVLWRENGRALRLASAAGFGVAMAGAGCGAWWHALSQIDGVCDQATGRPITSAAAVAVLAVAAEIMRSMGRDERGSDGGTPQGG